VYILIGMNDAVTFLGVSDDVTTCECCGRTNLRRTVALAFAGETRRYGTACAAKALSFNYSKKEIVRLAEKAQKVADEEAALDASYLASRGLKEEWA
jgi:hypothetical protein